MMKRIFEVLQSRLEHWMDVLDDQDKTPRWLRMLAMPFLHALWYYVVALCNPLGVVLLLIIILGGSLDAAYGV